MASQQTRGTREETLTPDDVKKVDAAGAPVIENAAPEGWENEQIGFPPYWNPSMKLDEKGKTIPETGNSFLGIPIDLDERNPDFPRYVIEAIRPIICKKGPAEDAEEILVKPGEFFTCSNYAALPLKEYFGYEVWVAPSRKRKLAANEENPQKRDLWDFDLKVSPKTKLLLKQRRAQEATALREKQERYRLEMIEKDAKNPL